MSAVAPPKSTAIRSIEIAPKSAGLRPIKRIPATASANVGSWVVTWATATDRVTSTSERAETPDMIAARTYGSGKLIACRRPPTAGPAIIAACPTEVVSATARLSEAAGTADASSGFRVGPTNAFPIPHAKASA